MADREKKIYKVTAAGSLVNLFLLLFKFIAGILGHSAAMIADAVHSLSDFVTDIIVIVFVKISSKPADEDHDYGHGKYETLASQIIGIALGGVGVLIGWKGIQSIIAVIKGETLSHPGYIALIAALLSILLKEIIFRVTRKVAKDVDSSALEANAWHHRSDALSSIGTAVGIGGAIFLGDKWAVLDPVAAVIVSGFIIFTAFKIIQDASRELLEMSLPSEVEKKIEEIVYRDPEAHDIHNMRTRKIGSKVAMEMHVRFSPEMPVKVAHEHATAIEKALKAEFGPSTHVMLHIEPIKNE